MAFASQPTHFFGSRSNPVGRSVARPEQQTEASERFERIRVTDIWEKSKTTATNYQNENPGLFEPGSLCFSDYPLLREDATARRLTFLGLE
jgi:hypothetical protein